MGWDLVTISGLGNMDKNILNKIFAGTLLATSLFILNTDTAYSKIFSRKPRDINAHYILNNDKSAVVYINNQEIFKYTQGVNKFTPEDRAKFFITRLKKYLRKNKVKNIKPFTNEKCTYQIKGKKQVLLVIDKGVQCNKTYMDDKVVEITDKIRQALGGKKLKKKDLKNLRYIRKIPGIDYCLSDTGVASWYGDKFHGKQAADGSIYNQYEMTAAHKTLPLGSTVKVTNLKNGKKCIVKITDRGPFVKGRIIDLSRAAAQKVEMISAGLAKVKIEVLD